ncbi:hypothetical protein ABZX75_33075 [Streptomyces sp. NPDC003038]|uniref:hypothetical protein n=1 Tax=Streptomyces sp. NPDC003038 TaxID=3154546 RepID=UPI0033B91EA1
MALLPEQPEFHPDHPRGCHRRRISDRVISDKMLRLPRFGCSYEAIADTTCSVTMIHSRRDERIRLGMFARLKQIDAFFDLADTIITVPSLIRQTWTTHRWNERPNRRP